MGESNASVISFGLCLVANAPGISFPFLVSCSLIFSMTKGASSITPFQTCTLIYPLLNISVTHWVLMDHKVIGHGIFTVLISVPHVCFYLGSYLPYIHGRVQCFFYYFSYGLCPVANAPEIPFLPCFLAAWIFLWLKAPPAQIQHVLSGRCSDLFSRLRIARNKISLVNVQHFSLVWN